MSVLKYIGLSVLLGGIWTQSWGEDTADLAAELHAITTNPALKLESVKRGQDRALLCGYCHGKDGNSVKEYIPNLAEQNPEYLINQFQLFASGERKSYVMEQISKGLTSSEMIDVALFYSTNKVTSQPNVQSSEKGMERYQSFCFACHGEDGKGNKDLPRLAGQKKAFLLKALKDFKHGKAARASSPMVRIMKAIQVSDIEPLADYIASMP